MQDVVVIGGGVAGLTAALHLAERGLSPLLLEANPSHIGGRLQDTPPTQFLYQGEMWSFPNEHGIHGIWSPYVNFKAMLTRHDMLPQLIPARDETWILGQGSRIRRAKIGRAIRHSPIPAPFHYLNVFLRPSFWKMVTLRDIASLFRVAGTLFAAMSIDPLAEQQALAGMSLADLTKGWSPTMRNLFAGLARNGLAAHPQDVPASGFIAFLRFYTLLRRDAWAFAYLPEGGGACVSQPLAERVLSLAGQIVMGAEVVRLQCHSQGWQVIYQQNGQEMVVKAKSVILAVSAPAAQKLLCASPDTADLAATLTFPQGIPTAIIRMWFYKRPAGVSEAGMFSGDFVVDNFFWLDQFQATFQRWREATGGSVVEMHIYGPREQIDLPDAVLLAQVLQDAYRAFPGLRGSQVHMALQRHEATHTLFSVASPQQHLAIETPWPNLLACGDWVYDPVPALYLERAITTGILAANVILKQRGLSLWPVLYPPAPEWAAGGLAHLWWRVRQGMKS